MSKTVKELEKLTRNWARSVRTVLNNNMRRVDEKLQQIDSTLGELQRKGDRRDVEISMLFARKRTKVLRPPKSITQLCPLCGSYDVSASYNDYRLWGRARWEYACGHCRAQWLATTHGRTP